VLHWPDVGELAVERTTPVRAGDELQRLARNRDDRVLVGMDSFGMVGVGILCQIAECCPPLVDNNQARRTGRATAVGDEAEIDDVGRSRRRVDDVVVPALPVQ
jgi:hypothetical protein